MSKRLLFEIHGWIGINLSMLFFIVCFSGTIATISHELDWVFNPSIRATPTEQVATRNEIVSNIAAAYPEGKILYWPAATESYSCQIVHLEVEKQRKYIFVNPYTGKVQGEAKITIQRFFRDFHYFLFMPFFQFGYFVVLTFGFMLLIATLTALFFYKKWWKKLFVLEVSKGARVFFRSLHRLVGLWSVPFTILFSVTGIWYFLERTNTGNIAEIANGKSPTVANMGLDSVALHRLSYLIDYNQAAALAEKAVEGLEVKDISVPTKNDGVLYLTGVTSVPLVRNRANRVYMHPLTYQIIKVQKASELNTVTWLNDIADPLHFGNWGGLLTKISWFVGGIAISGLILTGIWIALKRRQKSGRGISAFWKYLNWGLTLLIFVSMFFMLKKQYLL